MTKLKSLLKKKFLVIALAFLVVFLPFAITAQSTTLSRTVTTAMAIDKDGDTYTVYLEHMMFTFDPLDGPERKLISASADSIEEALTKIGHNRGRTISLSHCSIIILGPGIQEDDFLEILLPFAHRVDLNNATAVFITNSDVEELMEASIENGDMRSALLQQIAAFNKERKQNFKTLGCIVKKLLRNEQVEIPTISLEDDEIKNPLNR